MVNTDNIMTVAELIAQLQECDPDAYVITASDSEGNVFSPVSTTFGDGVYVAESSIRGEVWAGRKLTQDLKDAGFDEEDCYDEPDGLDCIVLYPTN